MGQGATAPPREGRPRSTRGHLRGPGQAAFMCRAGETKPPGRGPRPVWGSQRGRPAGLHLHQGNLGGGPHACRRAPAPARDTRPAQHIWFCCCRVARDFHPEWKRTAFERLSQGADAPPPPPQDCMLKALGTRHGPRAQQATGGPAAGALGLDADRAHTPRTHRPGWGARGAPRLHPPRHGRGLRTANSPGLRTGRRRTSFLPSGVRETVTASSSFESTCWSNGTGRGSTQTRPPLPGGTAPSLGPGADGRASRLKATPWPEQSARMREAHHGQASPQVGERSPRRPRDPGDPVAPVPPCASQPHAHPEEVLPSPVTAPRVSACSNGRIPETQPGAGRTGPRVPGSRGGARAAPGARRRLGRRVSPAPASEALGSPAA